jgi:type IV pilus assembly protein PilV
MKSPQHVDRGRGFTLVEVMVALVVLSLGLLGVAKMVMLSSHSNDSAYLRTQATSLAYEMLDYMRANVAGAEAGNYNTAFGPLPPAPTSCVGTGLACSNAQLAAWDIYEWKQRLTTAVPGVGALPLGDGQIVTTGTDPLTVTITVQWDDSAAQAVFGQPAAPNMTVVLQSVLQ